MTTKICRLPDDVVSRIAAGEVVVRPANAIKELIENALDAGASEIIVTAKNGGIDLLKVQDDGCGIAKNDMSIICERFTTSKLRKFEDLECMSTFGFRGEALSSISHVAEVTIVSRTKDSPCAFIGRYKDGKLEENLKPSAGLVGTTVTAENLFYNCPSRRRAMKYPADEMNRIADVVVRYALHNSNISFTLRRCGSGSDFRTAGTGELSTAVSSLLGSKIAKDLIILEHNDATLHFSLTGCMAQPVASCTAQTLQSRQNRQKLFVLFINGRSVECPPMKQALDLVFAAQNAMSPFVMLSLKIATNRVDVNVHPTKSIVYFLEQDNIITSVQDYIENQVLSSSGSRSNTRGSYLMPDITLQSPSKESASGKDESPGVKSDKKKYTVAVSESLGGPPSSASKSTAKIPHQMVRTDAKERCLEEFLNEALENTQKNSQGEPLADAEWRDLNLSSQKAMKEALCTSASVNLRSLFKEHTYIGAVDATHVVIQHSTSLYVIDARECLKCFFYQILVLSMGNFGSYKLSEVASVADLLRMTEEKTADEEISRKVDALITRRGMLMDYFCICINEQGELTGLPSLVDGFVPQLEGLPSLVLALTQDDIWEEERSCLESICRALADFYSVKTIYCNGDEASSFGPSGYSWKFVYKHILFPALKTNFLPPQSLIASVRRVADLHDLYKVFERC